MEEIHNILKEAYEAPYLGEAGNRLSKTDPNIFTREERNGLINGILDGSIEPNDANSPIISKTTKFLEERLQIGYGRSFLDQLEENDSATLRDLRRNISEFSEAKFRTQIKDIQEQIKGLDRPQARKRANELFDKYNKKYLKAEGNVTEKQTQTARNYNRLKNKKVKYLRYSAILDDRTRPEHRQLDGTIRAIDDPFWDNHLPPLGYNCRCRMNEVSGPSRGRPKENLPGADKEMFSRNPARSRTIFPKSQHPYFKTR